mgnify:CR=1 FL=1
MPTVYLDTFDPVPALDWQPVNDVVMGGRSASSFTVTEPGIGTFAGEVSLENNGGFASVRAPLSEPLDRAMRGLRIRVQGDGQAYNLRVRCSGRYSRVAYRVAFATLTQNWEEHWFTWADFTPTFRGRILTGVPHPAPDRVREVGFIIADKQAGPFSLNIDYIRAE